MFSDPISVLFDGSTSTSLARITDDGLSSTYSSADRTKTVDISHQVTSNGRRRTTVRLTQKKVSADPISSVNKEVSMSAYIVYDLPPWGFDDSDMVKLTIAIDAFLSAGTYAAVHKLYGSEH
jgi:hypothetical protein